MKKQMGIGLVVALFMCLSGLNYVSAADKLKLTVSVDEQFVALFWNNTGAADYTLYYAFPDSHGGIDIATIGDIPMGTRRTLSLIWPLQIDLYVAVYDGTQLSNVERISPGSGTNSPSLFDDTVDGIKSCDCTGSVFITYVDKRYDVTEITEIPICVGPRNSTGANYSLRMGQNVMDFVGKMVFKPGDWMQWEAHWDFKPTGEVVWVPRKSFHINFDTHVAVIDKLKLYEDYKLFKEVPVIRDDVSGIVSMPFESGAEMITTDSFGAEYWFQLKLNEEDGHEDDCLLLTPLVDPK